MAKHANGIEGQSNYISESIGTCACWTHAEQECTLLRWLHHLIKNTWRKHQKTATSFSKILQGRYKNQQNKMSLLSEESSIQSICSQQNGLKADAVNFEALQNFPIPQNQTDVKSFLGLYSYFRRNIKNFAMRAGPLHKASKTKRIQMDRGNTRSFWNSEETFLIHTNPCLSRRGRTIQFLRWRKFNCKRNSIGPSTR